NAIAQYLATKKPEGGLTPSTPRDQADVMRWQFWDSAHWDPACATLVFECGFPGHRIDFEVNVAHLPPVVDGRIDHFGSAANVPRNADLRSQYLSDLERRLRHGPLL